MDGSPLGGAWSFGRLRTPNGLPQEPPTRGAPSGDPDASDASAPIMPHTSADSGRATSSCNQRRRLSVGSPLDNGALDAVPGRLGCTIRGVRGHDLGRSCVLGTVAVGRYGRSWVSLEEHLASRHDVLRRSPRDVLLVVVLSQYPNRSTSGLDRAALLAKFPLVTPLIEPPPVAAQQPNAPVACRAPGARRTHGRRCRAR